MKRTAAILAILLLLCALAVGCQSETYTLASGMYYPEGVDPAALIAPSIRIDREEFILSLNPLMSFAIHGTVSRSGNNVTLEAVNVDFTMQFRLIGDNELKLTSDIQSIPANDWTDGMVFVLAEDLP